MRTINQIIISVACSLMFLVFYCIGFTTIFFALNISGFTIVFPVSFMLAIFTSWILCKRYLAVSNKNFVFAIGTSLLLFVLFNKIALSFYDVSWDGQAYHLEAIVKMSEGWNPFYETLNNSLKVDNIFINHYPRGAWFASFSLYALTGKIEGIKVFNYLWFIIAFGFCFVLLHQYLKFNFLISFFIGLLTVTNPVWIYQSASNYVDGQVAMALTTIIVLSGLLFYSSNNIYAILLAVIISVSVNLKFTMPFYTFILLAGAVILFFYHKNYSATKKILIATVSGFVFGIAVIGFSPYITNTIYHNNPIYPIADKSQDDINLSIENSIAPVSFKNMNRVEKLFASTFSKGVWSRTPNDNVLKIPGAFSDDELLNYARADPDMEGFGPFFSLVFLLSVFAMLFIYRGDKKIFFSLVIVIVFIMASVFLSEVGWLSRYAPQFYLVVVFILISLLLIKTAIAKYLSIACFSILLINDFAVGNFYYTRQRTYSDELGKSLKELSNKNKVVRIYFGRYESNRARFKENGIKFSEVKSLSELDATTIQFLPRLNHNVATD